MIYYAKLKNGERKVEIEKDGSTYLCIIDGKSFTVDARLIDGPTAMSLIVDKRCYEVIVNRVGGALRVSTEGDEFEIELTDELERRSLATEIHQSDLEVEEIKAPMPGVVVSVEVLEGQEVDQGSAVVIVEAMKMQNEISTLGGGRIKQVLVKPGDVVDSRQTLIVIDRL
jgi:biotin carboxyl carrier protein